MFHIKGHQSAQRQAAMHLTIFQSKGQPGRQSPHSLVDIGTRIRTFFSITRLRFRMRARTPDVSHRDPASRPRAGAKRTASIPFAVMPHAPHGWRRRGGLIAINWLSWGCSIPMQESHKFGTGSHSCVPRKPSELWLCRGLTRITCVRSPILPPGKASLPSA
jgi:hypothetical protein